MKNVELELDIQILHEKHGVSHLILESLTTNPKEARECIRFFKQMMFLFNGGLIAVGFGLLWIGLTHLSYVGYACILAGTVLVIRFTLVFMRQINAVRAMEHVAKKHSLI